MNKRTILKFLLIVIIMVLSLYAIYHFRNDLWNDERIWNIITAICTAIVAISVILMYFQLDLSKRISASDFAMKLDDKFNSQEMRKFRKKIVSLDYSKPKEAEDCLEILDFFEEVAHLEKKRVIDLDTIDDMWGYWFERYWVLCKGYVDYYRSCNDEGGEYFSTEELFEKLVLHSHRKMKKEKAKLARKKPHPQIEAFFKRIKEKQLEEFKKDESSLDCD